MSAARAGDDADSDAGNDARAASAMPPVTTPHFMESSARLEGPEESSSPARLRPGPPGGNGNRCLRCALCAGVAILPWRPLTLSVPGSRPRPAREEALDSY